MILVLMLALPAAAGAAPAPKAGSDLRIAKTDSPDPVQVGGTLTYTITVENLGPDFANGVTVTDSLPKGVDLVSANGSVGTCAQRAARKVVCDLGTVGPGVIYGQPPTVTILVIPRKAGAIVNTATVKGDGKDPFAANNKATATTRVLGNASCRGFTATLTGTPGADVLIGTGGPDVIVGLGGNDAIRSFTGADLICSGSGRDFVVAGRAADRVFGGSGRDNLLGRGGPDVLRGGSGFDRCRGGRGRDILRSCEH
ncbi:MAG TPA: hypothetical protein VFX45_13010 [Solirubrobacterales bacterium]|nr:hypothetical protein [Solirubrobacterales bacterium]